MSTGNAMICLMACWINRLLFEQWSADSFHVHFQC